MRRLLTTLGVALSSVLLCAQIPGRNVNMVSGVTWPDGDPYLQRQNEPSIAASTRNPMHLLAGANDYRTVDLPGLPNGNETGDAWLGLFTSQDGGQRWSSNLVPGYPQDRSAAGLISPLKTYAAAADPVVRAGTSGLFYYGGLAFNRGDGAGSAVFISRFIDDNNREDASPIQFLTTSLVAVSAPGSGRFFDKPWLAVDVPRPGAPACAIATTVRGTPQTQRILAGHVYMAFSSITGQDASLRSQIMFTESENCGATWTTPIALNSPNEIAQGATIAIDPITGSVYVAWRRFSLQNGADVDGIMVARSLTLGHKFQGAQMARKVTRWKKTELDIDDLFEHRGGRHDPDQPVAPIAPFDQGSSASSLSFRTNAYPTMTFDDRGRAYLAWTERGFSLIPSQGSPVSGDAKIVVASASYNGKWTDPVAIDPSAPGHQLMPTLTFAGGKLLAVYYDLRDDVSETFSPYIQDLPVPISSTGPKRHTMDIRAALGVAGAQPAFTPSVKISDYLMGAPPHVNEPAQQLQFNPPNLPMFASGTLPFMGDYIDVTPAPVFVPIPGTPFWQYNTSPAALPLFHAVWTDNRDVRAPANGDWTKYTPPTVIDTTGGSRFDPSTPRPVCSVGQAGSRNQNIYSARITGGLVVGAPSNAKPLSPTLVRGFVVFAQNATAASTVYRLQIASQPAGGRASFQQWFPSQSPLPPVVTSLDVAVLPHSTGVRTVYVTSSDPHAQVSVAVTEIGSIGAPGPLAGGQQGTILLNPDIENPDIENPDIENPDIENPDIENAEIMNPDIENLALANPDIENPNIANPDIENPDIENVSVANPDIENPTVANPDIENPDIENPDIENPDIENQSLTDITWTVSNTGNTTSGYNVDLFLNQATLPTGLKVQLVLYKTYKTPVVESCELETESRNVLVANVPDPLLVPSTASGLPDPNRPDSNNATLWLAPGESGRITLRVVDPDPTNNVTLPNGSTIDPAFLNGSAPIVTPGIIPQPVDTADANAGQTTPTVTTPFPASLQFIQQPTSTALGNPIAPVVAIQVRSKTGVPMPGVALVIGVTGGASGASLIGTSQGLTDANGIVQFPGLQVNLAGSGYQLTASAFAAGQLLGTAASAPFAVTPAATAASAVTDGTDPRR